MSGKMLANKKAGEHSTTISLSTVSSLIRVLFMAAILWLVLGGLVAAGKEAKEKGFCLELMKTRHGLNQVQLWSIKRVYETPYIGPAITGTSMFYVSPACGNMYSAPCATIPECQNMTLESIKSCRKMQEAEPETSRPCLTDLEINVTVTTELCKTNTNVCGTGADCISAAFGATGISNSIIDYAECPLKGSSLSILYDKSSIIIQCQGNCKTP